MKNFLRSLRCSWTYRGRLILSVLCACAAAVLWSLNLTAIYPVLKLLNTDQTLQQWVDTQLDEMQVEIERLTVEKTVKQKTYDNLQQVKQDGTWPNSPDRDRIEHELATTLTRLESRLHSATNRRYLYQTLKFYIIRYLPNDRFETLAWLVGFVIVGVALKGFFEFAQESLVGSVMNRTLYDLRNRFFRSAIHQDIRQFSEQGSHELMSRFTNDMELLGVGIKTLYGKVIAEPLKALACVIVACWISWQLTLMFLVLVPAALAVLTRVGRTMRRASRKLLERMSQIYQILQETFRGIRVVKGFAREARERRRFRTATKEYCRRAMQVVNLDAAASPVIELIGVAAVCIALMAGAYLVLEQKTKIFGITLTSHPLDAETLLQLYALLAAIADPVRKLSSVYTKLQSGAAAADRVFDCMDRKPTVTANSMAEPLGRHSQAIEFRDVCFSYRPGEAVLSHVNLRVEAGEIIALVGRNGCGKSTLVGMLTRFYDPDHGSVLVDGQDLRHAHLRSLRKQVGLVTQEVVLFDETIYANIAYGKPTATSEEVEAAAKAAYAHEFIMRLGQGYQTRVGEAGGQLSGGQKQRIALARAILRNPSILILDEFTNQVDSESEALIHQVLREFMRGRTTFIITHRLHTLEVVDRIVVMESGRIEAVGTHEELLATCDTYQRLHDAHFQRRAA